jgi:hypothetical protein
VSLNNSRLPRLGIHDSAEEKSKGFSLHLSVPAGEKDIGIPQRGRDAEEERQGLFSVFLCEKIDLAKR